jgi:hypothetical protein
MGNYTDLVNRLSRTPESDECYTPEDQVLPLLPYLNQNKTYYEATSGISSQIVNGFKKYNYKIEPSNGKDFFECETSDVYDGVITNPPYSLKDKFIEHCYNLKKPFALFLPVASFQGGKRGKMFMEYGMSALLYNNRVDFTGKGSPPFGNAWFMWGILPPNTIHWVDNPKRDEKMTLENVKKYFNN